MPIVFDLHLLFSLCAIQVCLTILLSYPLWVVLRALRLLPPLSPAPSPLPHLSCPLLSSVRPAKSQVPPLSRLQELLVLVVQVGLLSASLYVALLALGHGSPVELRVVRP